MGVTQQNKHKITERALQVGATHLGLMRSQVNAHG